MKLMPVLALLTIALCGCSEKSVVVSETSPASTSATASAALTVSTKMNVGDVESSVDVELTLEPGAPATVLAEELRNAKKKLNILTVTVSDPKPAELWIAVSIKTSESFRTRPTALRGKVFREVTKGAREEIAAFQTVLDGNASANSRRDPAGNYPPLTFRADAIKGLAELPASMLISAEVEAYMSPPETDPATIDPATYSTGPEDRGNLLSNPVRINYSTTPLPVAQGPVLDPAAVPAAPDAGLAPAPAPVVETPPAAAPAAEAPAASPITEAPTNTAPATQAIGAAQ